MYRKNISMALCGLPWRRRRRTVPEASLAPGNGGGAARRAQWLVEAPAAALPSHPVSAAVYSAAVCMCVKALQTSLLAYRSSCSTETE